MKHLMTYYLKVSSAWRRKFAYTAEEKTSWKCSMDNSIVKLMFSDYIDSSRTWKGSSYLIIQMKRFQFFLLRKSLILFFISSFIHSFIHMAQSFFVYWSIHVFFSWNSCGSFLRKMKCETGSLFLPKISRSEKCEGCDSKSTKMSNTTCISRKELLR